MADKIRLGLIGASVSGTWSARSHLPAVQASADVELTAVCTTKPASAEAARQAYGARLAFDLYVHRLAREAGGLLAVLGGMDALVFTGGIGENVPPVRDQLCRQLAFAGVDLNASKNDQAPRDGDIAARQSRVRVLVVHAAEEWEIARECHRLFDESEQSFRGSRS